MAKSKIKIEKPKRQVMQVKVVLQDKVEPFEDYQKRLNEMLLVLPRPDMGIVVPSASADGRMCCVINYLTEI
jgi:hypothetical protein